MLRSPRPTQRVRALPGVQVAGLSLCRRLCVRGQHTKTHFLGASLPDRPAHSWASSIPAVTTWTLAPPGARYWGAEAVRGTLGATRLVEAVAGISTPF